MRPLVWWLLLHDVPFDEIYMRKYDDFRKDYEVKRDILSMIRADGYDVTVAYDDNPNIWRLWDEEDIACVQVPGWSYDE
jgi:hypothetical protein